MSVTVNSIREGVITTLQAGFPDVEVYGENVAEETTPPYFFVELLQLEQTELLGVRYRRSYSFNIHYAAADGKNEAMHDMAEQLYERMRLITVDGAKYRGIHMKHQIVDGALHFFADYAFNIRYVEAEDPTMQQLAQEGSIK